MTHRLPKTGKVGGWFQYASIYIFSPCGMSDSAKRCLGRLGHIHRQAVGSGSKMGRSRMFQWWLVAKDDTSICGTGWCPRSVCCFPLIYIS